LHVFSSCFCSKCLRIYFWVNLYIFAYGVIIDKKHFFCIIVGRGKKIMKLICNGQDLSEAVSKVIKAASTRSTNSILEGIKLSAEAGTLSLTATDTELTIKKSIVADVKIEGETVVPGRFFAEFVRKLSKEQIELLLDEKQRLRIKYTDS
jgi:hypothetical protein